MGPIAPVFLGDSSITWVTKARVLGLTVDHKLTWDAQGMLRRVLLTNWT